MAMIGDMSIGIPPTGVFARSFLTGFKSGSVSRLITSAILDKVGFCQTKGNQLSSAFAMIRNSKILNNDPTALMIASSSIIRQPLGPEKAFAFKLVSEVAHNGNIIRCDKIDICSNFLNAAAKSINSTI